VVNSTAMFSPREETETESAELRSMRESLARMSREVLK